MKIKDLDRNDIYSLEEIKKDSAKFDLLKEWLKENDNWNSDNLLGLDDTLDLFYSMEFRGWYHDGELKPTKCALTLFDLDITDYQVDCSELSESEINNLVNIVKSKGYAVQDSELSGCFKYFKHYFNGFFTGLYESNKKTITYDKFMELFGEKEKCNVNYLDGVFDSDCTIDKGYKESDNKCNYELDFDFIRDLAMRIQNEPKYEPYNWQKPMDIEQLSNAMLRHAIEVKKGNFDDNGELGHILAIAANAMFIYYQKKNN